MGRSRKARAATTAPAPERSNRRLLTALYALSGFCFLSFETIWIRALTNQMGGTAFSSSVIISVFFIFAALGNLWASGAARRTTNSLKLYGACELLCAAAAALCFAVRPSFEFLLASALDASIVRQFAYAAMTLAVPSFFSGAGFPMLAQALLESSAERVNKVGPVYAANLVGAALGVLLGGVLLPQMLGYAATFYGLCVLLGAVGCVAVRASRREPARAVNSAPADESPVAQSEWLGGVILVSSGVLSILLEVLSITYARQFTAHSLYSVAAVLFAFIVNFGLGSWLAARRARSGRPPERTLAIALTRAGFFCVVAPACLQYALEAGLPLVAPSSAGSLLALALVTTVLFAPLHIPASMVFPLAWTLVKRRVSHQGGAFGYIVAWNKAGCAIGAFVGPFVLFGWIGLSGTLILAGVLYLVLGFITALRLLEHTPTRRVLMATAGLSLTLAALTFIARRALVDVQPPAHLLASYEGADGVIAVTEDANRSRHVVVNNSYVLNGTERALLSQRQESWIPLAFCKSPRRVAFIGMASGISAAAALDYPIDSLDAIELLPEVVLAARAHFGAWNAPLFHDPRAHIRVNDGRYVIQTATTPYDLIICDLLLPAQEGTSSIYSREFLTAARQKLAKDGKFCLWLPLYQLDTRLGGIAIRTFLEVFPNVIAVRGNLDPLQPTLALVGSTEPFDLSSEFLAQQLETPALQCLSADCPFFRSLSNFRLLLVGDLRAIAEQFQTFPLNTDDRPVFAFEGPREIPPPQQLRGFALLNWLGLRFLKPDYPSCKLGTTGPEELLAGIRAGNYFYAASINALPLPVSPEKQLERAHQTLEHLQTAMRLSPSSDLKETELGH